MTRDEAKKLLPLIQAFVEGKTIQVKTYNSWKDIDNPSWSPGCPYRIKPTTIKVYMVRVPSGNVCVTGCSPPWANATLIKEFELEIPEGECDGSS